MTRHICLKPLDTPIIYIRKMGCIYADITLSVPMVVMEFYIYNCFFHKYHLIFYHFSIYTHEKKELFLKVLKIHNYFY